MSSQDDVSKPRRMTLRDEQKRQTRVRLLETSRELFIERGYAAVTIDDIASTVGCSRATFYLHFASKMEVLSQISVETFEQRAAAVYEDLDQVLEAGTKAEFTGWVKRSLAWFERYKGILPAWDEALALEPEFKEIARNSIYELLDAMPLYLARWPADRQDEARLRIELLVTQLERFFTRWAVQGTIEFSGDAAAEVLSDIWYGALQAPAR